MYLARRIVEGTLNALAFDRRTISYIKFDMRRAWTRWRMHGRRGAPTERRLHLGAGSRIVPQWLNCDIVGSQHDVDLAACPLPFVDAHFTDIVSQHTIEHLEFDPKVLELFADCFRMLQPGGAVWFSCPDLEKICAAYVQDRCRTLDVGLKRHWPHAEAAGFPVQHRINFYFHQAGQHRNLMDFEMLAWGLAHAGFVDVTHENEAAFLAAYPGFPPRRDDFESIYVAARKPAAGISGQ